LDEIGENEVDDED